MPEPIAAVIFDMGGVITVPVFPILARYAGQVGLDPAVLAARVRFGAPSLERAERGEISMTEYFEGVSAEIRLEHGVRLDPARLVACLRESVAPADGSLELVREVGRRYRTAILTNNSQELTEAWQAHLPADLVDLIVDSSVVAMSKPEPRIYQLTLDRLGTRPGATVFVDDQEANLVPARELGMPTVLCESVPQCRAALIELGVRLSS